MARVSLKVPVQHLIDNAEAQRAEIIRTHARAVANWKDEGVNVRAKLADALAEAARQLDIGKKLPNPTRYWKGNKYVDCVSVTARVDVDAKPDPKADTGSVDRALKLLRATSQEHISVREDADLARYL